MWLILHCISQSTIDVKVNFSLHLLFLCPMGVCSTILTFTFLQVLNCNCKKYLNRKNFNVTTIGKDQATGELMVKSQRPYNQEVLQRFRRGKKCLKISIKGRFYIFIIARFWEMMLTKLLICLNKTTTKKNVVAGIVFLCICSQYHKQFFWGKDASLLVWQ